MSIHYELQPSGFVLMRVFGDIKDVDVHRILDALPKDELLPRPLRLLVDTRFVTSIPTDYVCSESFSEDLLHSLKSNGEYATIAYVVTSDLLFGLLRRSQMLLENYDMATGVFRQLQDACDWLGVPLAEVAPISVGQKNRISVTHFY